MDNKLNFDIESQPTDTTCGPTCLHSIYKYFNDDISLEKVINTTKDLKGGGTLAVFLACHALKRNYNAKIYTYNLEIFDPTWFKKNVNITNKLICQLKEKKNNEKLKIATKGYIDFLELGGQIFFEDLTIPLLKSFLYASVPIITGLSSTYLYNTVREYNDIDDDIKGNPTGHFVVLHGYDRKKKRILVADPLMPNPAFNNKQYYFVGVNRLIHSILLGIITHDANLLIIQPK